MTERVSIQELVRRDLEEREDVGRRRYGTSLYPHNGRKALVDAYQEVLDLAVYLRQELAEQGIEGAHIAAQDAPVEAGVTGQLTSS